MTLILGPQQVEAATSVARLISAIERGLAEEAEGLADVPPRLNMTMRDGVFRIMPSVMNRSGLMGFKAFHGSMNWGARYLIALFEQERGNAFSR